MPYCKKIKPITSFFFCMYDDGMVGVGDDLLTKEQFYKEYEPLGRCLNCNKDLEKEAVYCSNECYTEDEAKHTIY